jgi:hypothetical protein
MGDAVTAFMCHMMQNNMLLQVVGISSRHKDCTACAAWQQQRNNFQTFIRWLFSGRP